MPAVPSAPTLCVVDDSDPLVGELADVPPAPARLLEMLGPGTRSTPTPRGAPSPGRGPRGGAGRQRELGCSRCGRRAPEHAGQKACQKTDRAVSRLPAQCHAPPRSGGPIGLTCSRQFGCKLAPELLPSSRAHTPTSPEGPDVSTRLQLLNLYVNGILPGDAFRPLVENGVAIGTSSSGTGQFRGQPCPDDGRQDLK